MCNILFGISEQYFYFDRSSIVSKCFPPWSSDSKVDSIHASVCSSPHPHTQRCTGRAEPVFPGLLSFTWVYLLNHATCRMFQSSAAFSGDNRKLQSLLHSALTVNKFYVNFRATATPSGQYKCYCGSVSAPMCAPLNDKLLLISFSHSSDYRCFLGPHLQKI